MPHTTIFFLTKSKDCNTAAYHVMGYLETEDVFDYFTLLPDQSCPLENKREELVRLQKKRDWQEMAESYLKKAEC